MFFAEGSMIILYFSNGSLIQKRLRTYGLDRYQLAGVNNERIAEEYWNYVTRTSDATRRVR